MFLLFFCKKKEKLLLLYSLVAANMNTMIHLIISAFTDRLYMVTFELFFKCTNMPLTCILRLNPELDMKAESFFFFSGQINLLALTLSPRCLFF